MSFVRICEFIVKQRIPILLFVITLFVHSLFCFDTIERAAKYAATLPEYPDNTIQDWQNPNYSEFHT
jgi:hypothetical protein